MTASAFVQSVLDAETERNKHDSYRPLHAIDDTIADADTKLDAILTVLGLDQQDTDTLIHTRRYHSHRALRTELLQTQLQILAQDHAKFCIGKLYQLASSDVPNVARLATLKLLEYASLPPRINTPLPPELTNALNAATHQHTITRPIPSPKEQSLPYKQNPSPPEPAQLPITSDQLQPHTAPSGNLKPETRNSPSPSSSPRGFWARITATFLLLFTLASLPAPTPFDYNRRMTTTTTPSLTATQQTVPILDFGSQYVQLIARRVREAGVYSVLVKPDISVDELRKMNPVGVILSGGPSSVYEQGAPRCDPKIFDLNVPILGICYGMQIATQILGGDVKPAHAREYGRTKLHIEWLEKGGHLPDLLAGIPQDTTVWMSHGDQVQQLGPEFVPLASTPTCPLAAMRHKDRPFYGVQFHPEVTHTPHGTQILENFLYKICHAQGTWRMGNFIDLAVDNVRKQVKNGHVICGLSGGVDSSVLAALLHKAVGNQLTCIFVDNGLLRKNERQTVETTFRDHFNIDLRVVDASSQFLSALAVGGGVTDPQQKRKIIGKVFIDVFKAEAANIKDASFLAQGTLYPDVIESGHGHAGTAANIKLHHNVGGLPAELGFSLVEPLRDLFKDEVRKMGELLGLPEHIVWRHPFPGPGLAVRCIGEITEEKLALLRDADEIFLEEIIAEGLYRSTAQTFAAILPVRAVGVMGDGRSYQHVIALRSVDTSDFMTADWSRIPYEVLARVSNRIVNEVRGISRVVYDITSKPPGTIEWE